MKKIKCHILISCSIREYISKLAISAHIPIEHLARITFVRICVQLFGRQIFYQHLLNISYAYHIENICKSLRIDVGGSLQDQSAAKGEGIASVRKTKCLYASSLVAGWTQRLLPVVVGELVRSQIFVKSIVVSEFVCGHQVPSKDHLGPTYLHMF